MAQGEARTCATFGVVAASCRARRFAGNVEAGYEHMARVEQLYMQVYKQQVKAQDTSFQGAPRATGA
ncbi:hypothetical protein PsorP6_011939 [Peronosclerospora sorghi]|uniref:Uncharacterized protein n=1 Tax=Peronosclerospora sorghi TaxID=230839 RepID=A0ACC0WIX6_9STRA|nr:hypothetical protein PsorP6_011939 [Peronosclerospora sorghi]